MRPFQKQICWNGLLYDYITPPPQIYMASNTYVEYFNHTHQLKKNNRLGKLGVERVQWQCCDWTDKAKETKKRHLTNMCWQI